LAEGFGLPKALAESKNKILAFQFLVSFILAKFAPSKHTW
jgi:hypothetical protein